VRARAGLRASLFVVVAVFAVGCSSNDSGGSSQEPTTTSAAPSGTPVDAELLDGNRFTSTSVDGHDLAEGTVIELDFEDGSMSVRGGCNTMFGAYKVTDGTLAWSGEPAATLIGCEPELSDQDAWLLDLFTKGMAATSDGTSLTLTDGQTTIELSGADESSAAAEELLGQKWTVVGSVTDDVTSLYPQDVDRPFLDVGKDGHATLFTGCNSGSTVIEVSGSTVTFDQTAVTLKLCHGTADEMELDVLAVMGDGTSEIEPLGGGAYVLARGSHSLLLELE
jgi:heat shock protein HslJ